MSTDIQAFRSEYYAPTLFTEPRQYFINDPSDLKGIAEKIMSFSKRQGEYDLLENYYKNLTKINTRIFDDESKPNNRVGHPFAEVIVNTATSYFSGIPFQIIPEKAAREKELDLIHKINDADDVNSELDRLTNIFGHAFEIHWREEIEGKSYPRFKQLSPKNCMIFHSMELDEKPIGAVVWVRRTNEVTKEITYSCTVYTETTTQKFSFQPNKQSGIEILSSNEAEEHLVGHLPVIEYLNNEDRTSSFEKVIPLIDAYNTAVSDTINDVEYWADSYLVLSGMGGTDSGDIREMKRNRVMLLDGDSSNKAEFLTKNTNDKHLENIKDRLTADIHKFAQVPNLHDEQFATNLSGTAIRMKIKDLEDKTSGKERKFDKALRKRYEIIFALLDKKTLSRTNDFVEILYTRNIPQNLIEIADLVSKIPEGLWSNETLRTLFPFRYNEAEEKRRIKKESEDRVSNEMGANPFTNEKPQGDDPEKPQVDDPPAEEKPEKDGEE